MALGALRPLARSHKRQPALSRTGTAALVGKHAMVLERIANDEGVGCVRLDGEVWTARAYDEDDVIEQGKRVQVIEIRGATALVERGVGAVMGAGIIALVVLAFFVFVVAASGVRIVPQARAGVVERLGRYARTLDPGLTLIIPFVDRVKPLIDLREQVVTFPPQPVITEDNLVVGIDTVIYFTVTDAKAATYEVANPLQAIEQLTVTTLRNVIGGLTLEEVLTSRDNINAQLRVVLDEATGRWGIRVNRVELKSVEPPRTVQEAMREFMKTSLGLSLLGMHATTNFSDMPA